MAENPTLEPLPIQYGDFSVWQKEFLEGPEVAKQLAYWRDRLAGMTEVELPTDRPRPPVKTWKGDIISALLPKELTNRLQTIAGRHGATLFHLLLAAYKILLRRYSGGTDIARRHADHRAHARRDRADDRGFHQLAVPAQRPLGRSGLRRPAGKGARHRV